MKKIFFDTEFTGLHKATTLISMGLSAETGETFYAEFTDYDRSQVNDWIRENVIFRLTLSDFKEEDYYPYDEEVIYRGTKEQVAFALEHWLHRFDQAEMWSDCLTYDWVLFNDLFGTAFDIPKNVYYIPFDICTLFKDKGLDPDISREEYGCGSIDHEMPKHNALWDARVIKMCYEKLLDQI